VDADNDEEKSIDDLHHSDGLTGVEQ